MSLRTSAWLVWKPVKAQSANDGFWRDQKLTGWAANDQSWSTAAGKADRRLLGIENRGLNDDKGSSISA